MKSKWFYWALGAFIVGSIFYETEIYLSIRLLVQAVCLVSCLFTVYLEYTKRHTYEKRDKILLGFSAFFMLLSLLLKDTLVFLSIPFIFHARHYKKRALVFTCMLACTVSLFVIVLFSQFEWIHDYILYDYNGRKRHLLGFRYALVGPAIYFNIVCSWLYVRMRKLTVIEYLVLIVLNGFFYYMTRSRLLFITTIVLLVLTFFLQYFYDSLKKYSWLRLLILSVLPITLIVSFGLALLYDPNNAFMYSLNEFLEKRVSLSNTSLYKNGIHLFQNNIELVGNKLDYYGQQNSTDVYSYVDNFYVQFLLRYGILAFITLIGFVWKRTLDIVRKGRLYICLIVSVFVLHGIIDDLVFTLFYNSFLVLLFHKK